MQIPPEEIPKLLATLEAGDFDLVYGRYEHKKHSLVQRIGSAVLNAAYRKIFKTTVSVTSFRAIRRPLLEAMLDYDMSFVLIDGMFAWNTQRISSVTVEHCTRTHGASTYSMGKRVVQMASFFSNFSMMPLQQIMALGFITAFAGFALGAYYLFLRLTGQIVVLGFASTIIAILVIGGIQLLSLGVMGEYVGRIHMNVNRRPQYRERIVLDAATRTSARPGEPAASRRDAS